MDIHMDIYIDIHTDIHVNIHMEILDIQADIHMEIQLDIHMEQDFHVDISFWIVARCMLGPFGSWIGSLCFGSFCCYA